MDSLRGQLLVSSPKILDPNFRRTVVLIAEHTAEGAMGFVLTRPAAVTVGDAVPDLAWLADSADQIYVGGPVAAQSVIVLAEFDDPSLAAMVVTGNLGFIPAEPDDPAAPTPPPRTPSPRPPGAGACSPATPVGARDSSMPSWRTTPGSSSRPSPRTSSATTPTRSGGACSAARGASTCSWPRCRWTRR